MDITFDCGQRHQHIDGFGICQAFQRADLMRGSRGLPPKRQREVLDLLFSVDYGAGLSILRLGIGSSATGEYDNMRSIAPDDPGGPDRPLRFEWDGEDGGQVWLAKEAMAYGVRRFFASAWSAPGYMMSEGSDVGGGALSGSPSCPAGEGHLDWRGTYARYLLQYARFYQQEGIQITDLGFGNEPDLYVFEDPDDMNYVYMRMTPADVVDFVKVIGPAIEQSGLPLSLVSCDAMSWEQQAVYTAAVEADPEAARWVRIHAGHNYAEPAREPLPTRRATWMSEWEPDVKGNTWNPGWDTGNWADGIRVAEDVLGAFTQANISAYIYWLGASVGGTRALVQLDGEDYQVSKRLWALGAFSRYVRPGAVRVAATSSAEDVQVVAFANPDGRIVVNLLNRAPGSAQVRFTPVCHPTHEIVESYVTDEERSLAQASAASHSTGGSALDARSLTTWVVLPG